MTDLSILDAVADYINDRISVPTTIYTKVNEKWIPRITAGKATMNYNDDCVWINLEPVEGLPSRVKSREIRWENPDD